MDNFRTFITEAGNKGLTIFDIDDTMFKTKARVKVMPSGKYLTPKSFNTYKLGKGEELDFGEFKSAKLFQQTAVPIGRMISKFKMILKNAVKSGSKVIIVTARADMDDKKLFVNTFKAQGLDMDNVYIERAGNIGLDSAAKNKEVVFRKYLDTGLYKRIRLFDDAVENLKALISLKNEYPDVTFEAYRVKKDGSIQTMK